MKQLIESLRRLYRDGKIAREAVVRMFECKKISEDEMNYILA